MSYIYIVLDILPERTHWIDRYLSVHIYSDRKKKDKQKDRWIDKYIERQIDRYIERQIDIYIDKQIDSRCIERQIDIYEIDRQIYIRQMNR